MIETILVCLLVADFITGIVHWLEDTYGVPTWPILGPHVVLPNIEHHAHPGKIGLSGFVSRNYQSWLLATLIGATSYPVFGWPAILVAFFGAWGNEIHTWNHRGRPQNPMIVRLLQDSGLIQSPQQHGRHHRAPYDCYYCTLTNFTNAILEAVNFWRCLEWTIQFTTGIKPRRNTEARGGY